MMFNTNDKYLGEGKLSVLEVGFPSSPPCFDVNLERIDYSPGEVTKTFAIAAHKEPDSEQNIHSYILPDIWQVPVSDLEEGYSAICTTVTACQNCTYTTLTCFDPTRLPETKCDIQLDVGFRMFSGFDVAHFSGTTFMFVGGYAMSTAYHNPPSHAYPSNMTRFIKFGPTVNDTESWIGTDLPEPRFGHCATHINDSTIMILGGGHSFDYNSGYVHNYTALKSTLFYSIVNDEWYPGPEMNLAKGKLVSYYGQTLFETSCGAINSHNQEQPMVLSVAWMGNFSSLAAEIWSPALESWTLLPNIPCELVPTTDPTSEPNPITTVDVFIIDETFYVLVTDCQEGHLVFELDIDAQLWKLATEMSDEMAANLAGTIQIPSSPSRDFGNGLSLKESTRTCHTKLDNGK